MGIAMTDATQTSLTKSLENKRTMLGTVAPKTLRMPISFVRRLMVKLDSPSRPALVAGLDR
jgi:hypothetical protein